MVKKIEYRTGYKFEGTRITYLTDWGFENNRKMFLGVCECGTFLVRPVRAVRLKSTKSCGCILNEVLIKRNARNSLHNCSKRKGFYSYSHMLARCYNKNDPDYYNYGAKGVKVCGRWLEPDGGGVENFFEDMGEKPDGLSLDRIDTYGDYFPENCKWSNLYDQAYNKKFRQSNKTGKTGVMEHQDGGYVANIGYKGEKLYLGWFRTFEEAVEARKEAEIEYRGKLLGH